jgi:DnaJ-domain-containing protein 1
MNGQVLAGDYQGASLETLDRATLIKLLNEIDDDSRDLLAAYLDRREPDWREYARSDAGARARPADGGNADGGKMTEREAYQILALQPGASPEEISRAHRSLIKKLHPDQGGTTYLAARINEAKDVLLRRRR